MIRRLFAFASVLSLLLCVGTVGLWLRSFRIVDGVARGDVDVLLGHGNIDVEWENRGCKSPTRLAHYPADFREAMNGLPPPSSLVYYRSPGFHGFFAGSGNSPVFGLSTGSGDFPPIVYHFVVFPHWSVVMVFAALPAVWLAARLKARLPGPPRGFCPTCGYDLRASADRCPECGTPIPLNTGTSA